MLEWTGERYLPFIDPKITGAEIHYEHLHRYAFASQFVEGKDVLDLASGEGYGSYILSKKANRVIGIEIDQEAIAHASNKYIKNNLEFEHGTILDIPIEGTGVFDVIVCFEAVEHVEDHKKLISEVKRLLKADGLFIISTPDKKVYSDDPQFKNQFHVKELYFEDFKELLSNYFANIYFLGQRVYTGSNIWPILPRNASSFSDFVAILDDGEISFRDEDEKIPLYLIAVASNSTLNRNHINRSLFIDTKDTLIGLRDSRIAELGEEVRRSVERAESLDQAVSERDGKIAELAEEVRRAVEHAESLDQAVSERDGKIAELGEEVGRSVERAESLDQAVSDRDGKIAELGEEVRRSVEHAESLDQAVSDRDGKIAELGEEIRRAVERAESLDQAVSERDGRIAELGEEVRRAVERAESLDQAVSERDSKIAKLGEEVRRAVERAESLDQAVSERDGKIAELGYKLLQTESNCQRLENEMTEMRRSVVWQLVMKYHNGFVERFLPNCTGRRDKYDLGLKGCRILMNEGWGSLWWHYNERKRVKILERGFNTHAANSPINSSINSIESSHEDRNIEDVEFSVPEKNPETSILIPVYNNIDHTLNCLKSISKNTKGSFEVVLVDDASEDRTREILETIENIKVIHNNQNLGYVESCNRGARQCKGEHILLLNNDTIVTDNWLQPLLELMELQNVGAAGSKLVYPDGTLQEAGGIIWRDATGWNYGRGDDPEKPEYNFVRDVDYCSGAALIVRRDLFEKLGGFDEQFKPGYYEDTDLCFRIRNLDYRVLYQPKSIVVHFEGMTSGTDINAGMKRYQEVNREKFLKKWNGVLEREHQKSDSVNLFSARIRRGGKSILVIDHYVPTFDKDSGSYRMYNLLEILVEVGHKVTFVGDNLARLEPYTTKLQQLGVEILYHPYISSIEEYLMNNGNLFDMVILSRAHIVKEHIYSARKYCSNAKIIFDTVDLQFLRESRRAELENNENIKLEAEKLKMLELQLARLSDITLVVSPIEREILLEEDPSLRVEVLSNIHKINGCQKPFSERKDIMFLGGFGHIPNVDGVKWFVEEIFPSIKERMPEVVFYVVGNDPPEDIKSLNSEDIIVTGYVEDLSPHFNSCRVFVSPLRYGAGVKGKINQSMSFGLPVVTTSIGAEGMGLVDGENALISDNPKEFADKVVELYENEWLWYKVSRNSIENVEANFSYKMTKNAIIMMINNP